MYFSSFLVNPEPQKPRKRPDEHQFLFDTTAIEAWRFWRVRSDCLPGADEDNFKPLVQMIADAIDSGDSRQIRRLMRPHLSSWGAGSLNSWPGGRRAEALCSRGETHTAPEFECECGFWAFRDAEDVYQQIASQWDNKSVFGRVALWGHFIEFECGYRAQYAYPIEIFLVGYDDTTLAADLSETYGVSVSNIVSPEQVEEIKAERKRQQKVEPESIFTNHSL